MKTGTVKAFLSDKGYGFIAVEEGGPDFFFHSSAVPETQRSNLVRGAKVSFEVGTKRGKPQASAVEVLAAPPMQLKPETIIGRPFVRRDEPNLTFEEEFDREWGLRPAK
jgi:CspA family cold shock protein